MGLACSPLHAGVYTGYDLDGNGREDYADDDGNIWNSYDDWASANSYLSEEDNSSEDDGSDDANDPGNPPDNPNPDAGSGEADGNNGGVCQPPDDNGDDEEEATYIPPPPEPPPPEEPIITQPPPEPPPEETQTPKKIWKKRLIGTPMDHYTSDLLENAGWFHQYLFWMSGSFNADDDSFSANAETHTMTWSILDGSNSDTLIADRLTGTIALDEVTGNLNILAPNGDNFSQSNQYSQVFTAFNYSGSGSHRIDLMLRMGGSHMKTESSTLEMGATQSGISIGGSTTITGGSLGTQFGFGISWEAYQEDAP